MHSQVLLSTMHMQMRMIDRCCEVKIAFIIARKVIM